MSHITSALCIIPACAFTIVFGGFACFACFACYLPPHLLDANYSSAGVKRLPGAFGSVSHRTVFFAPKFELVMTEACFLNNRCQEEEAGCVSGGWLLHVDDDVSGFLLHAAASLLPRKLSPGEAE